MLGIHGKSNKCKQIQIFKYQKQHQFINQTLIKDIKNNILLLIDDDSSFVLRLLRVIDDIDHIFDVLLFVDDCEWSLVFRVCLKWLIFVTAFYLFSIEHNNDDELAGILEINTNLMTILRILDDLDMNFQRQSEPSSND